MTTPGTTLIEELEHACNSASVLAMYARRDGDENRAQIHRAEATRLHQRYTRVRDFPRVLSGELQIPGVTTTAEMFEWLTGPIPEAVAIEQVRPPEAAPIETRDEGSCTICGEKGEG